MGELSIPPDPLTWVTDQIPLILAPLLLSWLAPRSGRYRPLLLAGAIALLPFTLNAPFTVPPTDLRWDGTLDTSARFWLLGFLWCSSLGLGSFLLTVQRLREYLPRWGLLGLLPVGLSLALRQWFLPQLHGEGAASHLAILLLTALPIWLYVLRNPRRSDHD